MPTIQSLRVLEGAASLALLFSPGEANEFLKELGIEAGMPEVTTVDIHKLKRKRSADNTNNESGG